MREPRPYAPNHLVWAIVSMATAALSLGAWAALYAYWIATHEWGWRVF